ncbi:MAG: deoxyhypusine synthase [Candidatus Odinarchaeia archaeon]
MSPKYVKPIEIDTEMSLDELVKQYEGSGAFGAGRLSEAVAVFERMASDIQATKFLGLAGALVPAGLKKVINETIKENYINVIVSTGANLTHDLVEAVGGHHEHITQSLTDIKLHKLGINRIYDIYVRDSEFALLEDNLQEILKDIDAEKRKNGLAVYELLWEIGKRLNDKNSILRVAWENKCPIFCPAITDSILGLQLWLFSQQNPLYIDVLKDLQKMIDMAYDAKTTGILSLGGGVPKNHILQTMLITGRGFDYAIQITMDRPEPGGLSGASLSEAQSWGKIKETAPWVDLIADVTIVLPIIVGAVKERLAKKERS